MSGQACPICGTAVALNPRYRFYLCEACARRAVDETGRQLRFSNVAFSGGFIAFYPDTREERESHVCFVDGVRCWADEARFGGIVIEAGDGPSFDNALEARA